MSLVTCCRDATRLLTDASEGALVGAERVSFAFHLTICPHCRRYREQLTRTVEVLQAMTTPAADGRGTPTTEDVDDILRRIADAKDAPTDD